MRKKLSVLCATFLLSLLMTVSAFAADISFSDIPADAPYAESVAFLVERGITNGTGSDTFSPDAPLTVRQWAVMLCRAYDLPLREQRGLYSMQLCQGRHSEMFCGLHRAPDQI